MKLVVLQILTNSTSITIWYSFGILAAIWARYDLIKNNTEVDPPLKVDWPIIMVEKGWKHGMM